MTVKFDDIGQNPRSGGFLRSPRISRQIAPLLMWQLLLGLVGLVGGADVHVTSSEVASLLQLEKSLLLSRHVGRDQSVFDDVREDLNDFAAVETSEVVGKRILYVPHITPAWPWQP